MMVILLHAQSLLNVEKYVVENGQKAALGIYAKGPMLI